MLCTASLAVAATATGPGREPPQAPSASAGSYFQDVLSTQHLAYRQMDGPDLPSYPVMAVYVVLIIIYARMIASRLPGRRGWRYAAAAVATSRMRWTMARKPFERCDDR